MRPVRQLLPEYVIQPDFVDTPDDISSIKPAPKRGIRTRAWCFTLNNPTEQEFECLSTLAPPDPRYIVYQYEVGKKKTPHVQGYIYRLHPVARPLPDLPRAHCTRARGSPQDNQLYCTKEEGRLDGPWERGELPDHGRRTDLDDFFDLASTESDDVLFTHSPSRYARFGAAISRVRCHMAKVKATARYQEGKIPLVIWLWGPTRSGKTSYVFRHHAIEHIYVWSASGGHKGELFFNGYTGQPVLCLDDFYGQIPIALMLRLLDRYPTQIRILYGFMYLAAHTIYITSNVPPSLIYTSPEIPDEVRRAFMKRITRILEFGSDQTHI